MEDNPAPVAGGIRLSDSPRRSPHVTHALRSPAQSVHPDMQGTNSIQHQPDHGLRTTDFFDESSEDDALVIASSEMVEGGLSGPRVAALKKTLRVSTGSTFASQCEPKRVSLPTEDGYQQLAANAAGDDNLHFTDTPSSSFSGSVEELLSEEERTNPCLSRLRHKPNGLTPRSSAQVERTEEPKPAARKVEQILGAHAIAHEITLQALMRDEGALDGGIQGFAPLQAGQRTSLLPAALHLHDPRSPRHASFHTPQSGSSSAKRVRTLPPPIDTLGPRPSLPENLVRTPYPYTPRNIHPKDWAQLSPTSAQNSPPSISDSLLTLSVRSSHIYRLPRVTTIRIPAPDRPSTMTMSRLSREGGHHHNSAEFDDAELFHQVRLAYRTLSGLKRFFSACSLSHIAISGPATKAADAGYGWLNQPRSPRMLAYRGRSDTFSEEKIFQHYRKPELGRSRYAFVHWAHRIAAAPILRTPQVESNTEQKFPSDLITRVWQPEGLEFVVTWSVLRILCVLLLVLVLSVVAAMLWIFLGTMTVSGRVTQGGYRDAGDRVSSGVLIGMCALLVGLSSFAGWLGVSWLVM